MVQNYTDIYGIYLFWFIFSKPFDNTLTFIISEVIISITNDIIIDTYYLMIIEFFFIESPCWLTSFILHTSNTIRDQDWVHCDTTNHNRKRKYISNVERREFFVYITTLFTSLVIPHNRNYTLVVGVRRLILDYMPTSAAEESDP